MQRLSTIAALSINGTMFFSTQAESYDDIMDVVHMYREMHQPN
jgi:hypothetical protein